MEQYFHGQKLEIRLHIICRHFQALCKHYKQSMSTPWSELPKKVRDAILFGTGKTQIEFVYDDGSSKTYKTKKAFEGVINNIERRWKETDSSWIREELSKFQSNHPCEACEGLPS